MYFSIFFETLKSKVLKFEKKKNKTGLHVAQATYEVFDGRGTYKYNPTPTNFSKYSVFTCKERKGK
jgi:hypothetical protein